MAYFPYFVAGWLMVMGAVGIVWSRNLVRAIVCLSVTQSGTYVLLLAIGYQRHAVAPILGAQDENTRPLVDPVVQAMTLTDIVVSAGVTALLLAIAVQVARRHRTTDPDQLSTLTG
ncbi:MAG: NADH-quinone oxidoreductase subunit K [Acidothermus sp.]|nr:NADH-quinone oxidoreductase subunit K [Acidothermus sp.]MCL6538508.1 sodium:proton antiporter [Acidothermus sp.]